MKERNIQNEIRLKLAPGTALFRVNAGGEAWTGNEIIKLADGSVLIRDARRFIAGVPAGFSDLFGIRPVTITEDMVGETLGVFVAIEVKAGRRTPTEKQDHFISFVKEHGGRAGIARSVEDAQKIIDGG